MIAARTILLVIHIFSAGCWISSFPIGLILSRMAKANPGQAPTISMIDGELSQVLGQIGGLGILITGLGLIAIDKTGFLGIGAPTPTWMFIKQVVYIILVVIGVAVMMPQAMRLGKLMEASKGAPTAESRAILARLGTYGYVINLLVFINIVLAVWQPH